MIIKLHKSLYKTAFGEPTNATLNGHLHKHISRKRKAASTTLALVLIAEAAAIYYVIKNPKEAFRGGVDIAGSLTKSAGQAINKRATAAFEGQPTLADYTPEMLNGSEEMVRTITLKPKEDPQDNKAVEKTPQEITPSTDITIVTQEEFDANHNAQRIIQSCNIARDFFIRTSGKAIEIPQSNFPNDALFCLEVGAQEIQNCTLSYGSLSAAYSNDSTIPQGVIRQVGRCASAQLVKF